MQKHTESHLDHGLTEPQISYLLQRYADRRAFFIETVDLHSDLGTVPCGLYGPIMGDAAIGPAFAITHVSYGKRGDRPYESRLIDLPARPTRKVTVIAGPHDEKCPDCENGLRVMKHTGGESVGPCATCNSSGRLHHACIVYTAFGGPVTPQEPGDLRAQLAAATAELASPALNDSSDAAVREAREKLAGKISALAEKLEKSEEFWSVHALAR